MTPAGDVILAVAGGAIMLMLYATVSGIAAWIRRQHRTRP